MNKRIYAVLDAILRDYCTEQQGFAPSGPFETAEEYANRWFGNESYEYEVEFTGEYRNNARYLYSYCEKLSDISVDAVVKAGDCYIYLYLLDD